ncbi:MAG: alpha/beta hydrolase [Terriglobales bacterium]|jgi:acetyl esterase/lipase
MLLGLIIASCSSALSQQTVIQLWPHATPEKPVAAGVETDVTQPGDGLINGHRSARLTNVSHPTITIYRPPANVTESGAAALVFPGGGYQILAWDGEGVDTCTWLTSIGITCLLVKYRVPNDGRYPDSFAPLEDAQQAMRLARLHAREWRIDPARIGVVGFSAGADLAVLLSTHPDDHHVESTPAASEADARVDARPNFAILVYPAFLTSQSDDTKLDPARTPNTFTPPTFLIEAENDIYGRNAPLYYQALASANIPAELHMYATGGHGFGITPKGEPEEHWTDLAKLWLRSLGVIPKP